MMLLGVDPGVTTGLCVVFLDFNRYSIEHSQVEGLDELDRMIHFITPDIIICEGFDRRQKPGEIVPIIKGIAIVDLYVERYNIPLEMQSASYGKAFWDNGKLKRVGMYAHNMKHANDATRHVLQYLSNKGNDKRFIMMLKPEDFTA